MPNWCDNYLVIEAEPHVIEALLAKAKGKPSRNSDVEREFSYLPFLQQEIDACENYEASWYEFNIGRLGCKWFPDIGPDAVFVEGGRMSVSFDSPWSPPVEGTRLVAEWLREQGFSFQLRHSYEEGGNSFCGVFTADEDGEQDQCGDYVELDAVDLRADDAKAEDYAGICQSFGMTFEALKERAKGEMDYVILCPDYYQPYARY
jgi:hypothetical protein